MSDLDSPPDLKRKMQSPSSPESDHSQTRANNDRVTTSLAEIRECVDSAIRWERDAWANYKEAARARENAEKAFERVKEIQENMQESARENILTKERNDSDNYKPLSPSKPLPNHNASNWGFEDELNRRIEKACAKACAKAVEEALSQTRGNHNDNVPTLLTDEFNHNDDPPENDFSPARKKMQRKAKQDISPAGKRMQQRRFVHEFNDDVNCDENDDDINCVSPGPSPAYSPPWRSPIAKIMNERSKLKEWLRPEGEMKPDVEKPRGDSDQDDNMSEAKVGEKDTK
jgi:hypothetical protein